MASTALDAHNGQPACSMLAAVYCPVGGLRCARCGQYIVPHHAVQQEAQRDNRCLGESWTACHCQPSPHAHLHDASTMVLGVLGTAAALRAASACCFSTAAACLCAGSPDSLASATLRPDTDRSQVSGRAGSSAAGSLLLLLLLAVLLPALPAVL